MKRYAITLAVVCGFVGTQWALWPVLKNGPFIFLYPAVVVSALYGSAPLAVALCMLSAQYLFFEPRYSFQVGPGAVVLAVHVCHGGHPDLAPLRPAPS